MINFHILLPAVLHTIVEVRSSSFVSSSSQVSKRINYTQKTQVCGNTESTAQIIVQSHTTLPAYYTQSSRWLNIFTEHKLINQIM